MLNKCMVIGHLGRDPEMRYTANGSAVTTVTASDVDLPVQTLTYSLDGSAMALGMSIDPASGAFSWTPSEGQGPGSYTFDVVVSDGILSASETITIKVSPTWQNPFNAIDVRPDGIIAPIDALLVIGFGLVKDRDDLG